MPENETDEEIILLYKNGDEESFKKLINRYASPLYNFILRIAGANEAQDIVQEVFIKVWKKINRFDPHKASFKTWIFTIAKNTTADFLRKKKNVLFSDLNQEDDEEGSFEAKIPAKEELPDEILQKLEDSQFLNNLLKKLRPEYQEILILHYQEEMTFEEIGEILDKSINTVKSQHRRAILELKKMLS